MAGRGNVVPVYREVRADLETPVSAFLKVARGDFSFLLESVEGGERLGRYSFIGAEPYRVLECSEADGDPLAVIDEELSRFEPVEGAGLPRFHGGAWHSATSATRSQATSSDCRRRSATRSGCLSRG